jgi:hypothetical protein
MDPAKVRRLEDTRQALEIIVADVQAGHYPASMLEDFKEAVDHLRTTIWAIIKVEEGQRAAQSDSVFDLQRKVAELRLARGTKLLQQVKLDVDASEIEVLTPGIVEFEGVVKSLSERLKRLFRSGG